MPLSVIGWPAARSAADSRWHCGRCRCSGGSASTGTCVPCPSQCRALEQSFALRPPRSRRSWRSFWWCMFPWKRCEYMWCVLMLGVIAMILQVAWNAWPLGIFVTMVWTDFLIPLVMVTVTVLFFGLVVFDFGLVWGLFVVLPRLLCLIPWVRVVMIIVLMVLRFVVLGSLRMLLVEFCPMFLRVVPTSLVTKVACVFHLQVLLYTCLAPVLLAVVAGATGVLSIFNSWGCTGFARGAMPGVHPDLH
ncbi:unnamed protein product [Prorocentrum cordatum]|uniref:Uncharacterized protein n=1 Tax=Prorocentrum cordatum TaxID=2364126 RepID=A0ABN9WAZ1_9DINO|nr:unnamed protein product [Polarella glacialis]